MSKILIVDAGSTKTDWQLIDTEMAAGEQTSRSTRSGGINAMLTSDNTIDTIFGEVYTTLLIPEIDSIYYYGAGCATTEACDRIRLRLQQLWPLAETVEVHSDMLGAARGLLGHKKGIACILGTGSNSCLYNGHEIINSIPSLGYILGDEGSGAALGKRLLSDIFKKQLPEEICKEFFNAYPVTKEELLNHVYRMPAPNQWLAEFVGFLDQRLLNPHLYQLVLREFTRFVKRNVSVYPSAHTFPIAFTGSIAWKFEKILREAASQLGYSIKAIDQHPINGLIEYHTFEALNQKS